MKNDDYANRLFYNRIHYGTPSTKVKPEKDSEVSDRWTETCDEDDDELDDDIMISDNF